MKKELKMRHIFVPVLVVVVILCIVAAVINNTGNDFMTNTDGQPGTSHTHADGEVHYDEH